MQRSLLRIMPRNTLKSSARPSSIRQSPLVLSRFNSSSSSSSSPPTPPSSATRLNSTSTPITATLARAQKKHKAKKTKATSSTVSSTTSSSSSRSAGPSLSPSTPTIPGLLPLGLGRPSSSTDSPSDGMAIALTSAENYDTVALVKTLESLGLLSQAINLLGEAIYLPNWSPPGSLSNEKGEVFVFESGTIVTWGLEMKATEAFLRSVIRGPIPEGNTLSPTTSWVEQGRYNEFETEVLEFWTGKEGTTMQGDAIHLSTQSLASSIPTFPTSRPSKDLLARLAFSAGMARVTKLGVYEEQLDTFASHVAAIPKLLESGSEAPVRKTDIIKRVGTLHGFRQKLNLEDENLLDEPEFLWNDEKLHGYYTSVCRALEFDVRLRNLNDRVDYAFQLQSTLMELLNTKTSHRLEWIIILLIAFEITIVLIREGFAIAHGDEEKPAKKVDQVAA